MSDAPLSTVLEAILFGAGRSMSTEELSELLEKPQGEVQTALRELQAHVGGLFPEPRPDFAILHFGASEVLGEPAGGSESSGQAIPPAVDQSHLSKVANVVVRSLSQHIDQLRLCHRLVIGYQCGCR